MRHGDLVRDGDEFNREPHYWCAYCGFAHGKAYKSCFDALPGTQARYYQDTDGLQPAVVGQPVGLVKDPLTAVIDRQLEIERKAWAWDSLRRILTQAPAQITPADVLRRMDGLAGPPARDQDLGKG